MTIRDIIDILDAQLLVGHDQVQRKVEIAGSADMASEFNKFAKPGTLILTGLTDPEIVQSAHILDATAIVFVRGKTPPDETVQLAEELKVPLLTTHYILFETSGRLYANGICGCVSKIERSSLLSSPAREK